MAAPSSTRPPTAGLLLTGGASRRMGCDKATIVIDGDPLARRTAALLCLVAAPVIEVGPGYTSLPHAQEDPLGSGPLAAVAAGAAALRQLDAGEPGPVLVVATDLPGLTTAYLELLVGYHADSAAHSVVPRDALGRAQPLCARYSPAALALARDLVAEGHRSMRALLERVALTWVDSAAGSAKVLRDIDTPADLEAFRQADRPMPVPEDPVPEAEAHR